MRLQELGTVRDTVAEPRFFADLNGKSVVGFSITRSNGVNETTVENDVNAGLNQLRSTYPDVKIDLIDPSVDYTRGSYRSTMTTLK